MSKDLVKLGNEFSQILREFATKYELSMEHLEALFLLTRAQSLWLSTERLEESMKEMRTKK